MAWLYDILRDGTLVDNQSYEAREGVLTNRRLEFPLVLAQREGRKRHTLQNNTKCIWEFMYAASQVLEKARSQEGGESLVLFNEEEYVHNSEDSLLDLQGTDARNFILRTGNVIGSIHKGDYSLKISSRFGDDFLKFIIADADGFLEVKDSGGERVGDGYEWLLIYLWLTKLKRAYRLGMPKSYVSRDEVTNRVRGRIDPVKYESGRKRAVYQCAYREHSYSNPATALISETFRHIDHHSLIDGTHNLVNAFAQASEGIRTSRLELLRTSHFTNPYYHDYNVLIDLSKRILRHKTADFGDETDTSAFLFDVSMLFEFFIRKLLKRAGARFRVVEERGWRIPGGGKIELRRLKPDLVFSIGGSVHLYDVKYKTYDFLYGVAREDLFQLHTYLGQCMNTQTVSSCGFIYPVSEKRWKSENLQETNGCRTGLIQMAGKSVPFNVLFLKVPDSQTNHFNERFKQNCDQFLRRFA